MRSLNEILSEEARDGKKRSIEPLLDEPNATAEQTRWFRRLRRCISNMPKNTAVLVRHGSIDLIRPIDRENTFAATGSLDACPALDFFSVDGSKIEPAGEGL